MIVTGPLVATSIHGSIHETNQKFTSIPQSFFEKFIDIKFQLDQRTMKGLEVLIERSPAEYFQSAEKPEELVLTSVWKSLLSAGLVDSQHEQILIEQIFDVFDVAVLQGIRSLVVDVFQEIQSEDIMRHCGVTTIECLLQWLERCIVFCQGECADIREPQCDREQLQESLERALAFAEASNEVSTYILSWKNIEKSIHYKQSDSAPLSQSLIKSFTGIQSTAQSLSFSFKSMLIGITAGGDSLFGRRHQAEPILEMMQETEGTLLSEKLREHQYQGSFKGKSVLMILADVLLHEKNSESSTQTVLAILSYCLLCADVATVQDLEQAMLMYLSVSKEDVIVWSLAVCLDRASGDPRFLEEAKSLSQEDVVCGKIPIEYLQKFLALGEAPTALSLLYQKWIDPNKVSDVIGCIQILLHQRLVLECYVQVKQYLRQIPKGSYHHKAKLYWQEMFASGSKSGMLFQLIRLPISVNFEEEYVIDWLMSAYEQDQDSKYIKALCLYFIVRGRTAEASTYFEKLSIDSENELDLYLSQVIDIAKHCTVLQDDGSSQFMFKADSTRGPQQTLEKAQDMVQRTTQSNILFSKDTMDTDRGAVGVVFESKPSMTTMHGVRKNIKRTKEPHAFDKVLGLA